MTQPMERKFSGFQLLQYRAAIKLEKIGMKHSNGRSVAAHVKKLFGLPRTTSYDTLIQIINDTLKGESECATPHPQ